MHNTQTIQMMARCVEEIRMLRHRIALLEPKAEAWDVLAKVIYATVPERSRGASEDLVWRLEKEIATLQQNQMEPAPEKNDDGVNA